MNQRSLVGMSMGARKRAAWRDAQLEPSAPEQPVVVPPSHRPFEVTAQVQEGRGRPREGGRRIPRASIPVDNRHAHDGMDAMIIQQWKPRDLVYEDYMRRINAPVARRRSKRGQRRTAAKQWWVR